MKTCGTHQPNKMSLAAFPWSCRISDPRYQKGDMYLVRVHRKTWYMGRSREPSRTSPLIIPLCDHDGINQAVRHLPHQSTSDSSTCPVLSSLAQALSRYPPTTNIRYNSSSGPRVETPRLRATSFISKSCNSARHNLSSMMASSQSGSFGTIVTREKDPLSSAVSRASS